MMISMKDSPSRRQQGALVPIPVAFDLENQ
jgi:hypothetical protein